MRACAYAFVCEVLDVEESSKLFDEAAAYLKELNEVQVEETLVVCRECLKLLWTSCACVCLCVCVCVCVCVVLVVVVVVVVVGGIIIILLLSVTLSYRKII